MLGFFVSFPCLVYYVWGVSNSVFAVVVFSVICWRYRALQTASPRSSGVEVHGHEMKGKIMPEQLGIIMGSQHVVRGTAYPSHCVNRSLVFQLARIS
jgi:hypothetical protein